MSRRNAVTRANRRRSAAKANSYERTQRVIEGRRFLEATDGKDYLSANYEKISGKGWVFKEGDPGLEFLRYCGKPEDAAKAMRKRGFKWRWR